MGDSSSGPGVEAGEPKASPGVSLAEAQDEE